jgi:hypothetical protein
MPLFAAQISLVYESGEKAAHLGLQFTDHHLQTSEQDYGHELHVSTRPHPL